MHKLKTNRSIDKTNEERNKQPIDASTNFEEMLNDYIHKIRLGQDKPVSRRLDFDDTPTAPGNKNDDVRQAAKERVLAAEKYRASVEPPKGKSPNISPNMLQVFNALVNGEATGVNYIDKIPKKNLNGIDDKFWYVACHIEDSLKEKIRRGEFVELEKLLPRNDGQHLPSSAYNENDERKMSLVSKGGETYFTPVSTKRSIYNLDTWDHAFRVYSAIYSKANPTKAAEITQYVHTIHYAASKIYLV